MNTPWGKSDSQTRIQLGVTWVGTPSHGGLMVSTGQASRLFTATAIAVAHPGQFGGYVCFEEDCSFAVAFFEHPDFKRHLDQLSLAEWENSVFDVDSYMGKAKSESVLILRTELSKTDAEISADMRLIVERWNPEYFGHPPRLTSENGKTFTREL